VSWGTWKLNELGAVSRGRSRTRPRNAAHLYEGPYPFIQTGDVKHSSLYVTEHSQTYSEAGLEQSKLWPAGTLCITIAANIADTAILSYDACFPDSIIGFIPDAEKADARFIKYYFDVALQSKYKQFSQGVAQDNLSQEKLLSLDMVIPNVEEQKKIADKIAVFDDLIENNRRRIVLLEQACRLLYREWFIYLRFPLHAHVRVMDGVPEGWDRKLLGNIATLNYGKALKEENRLPGAIPVYGSSGVVGSHETALSAGPGIIIGRKGNVGSVYWSPVAFFPIDTVYFIDAETSNLFLYYALQHMQFISTDVAVPGLNRDFAYSRTLLTPPQALLDEFLECVTPMHQQIDNLIQYNKKLSEARDLLLPRLINGQI
jgi:type I restriction enzyme S subunit